MKNEIPRKIFYHNCTDLLIHINSLRAILTHTILFCFVDGDSKKVPVSSCVLLSLSVDRFILRICQSVFTGIIHAFVSVFFQFIKFPIRLLSIFWALFYSDFFFCSLSWFHSALFHLSKYILEILSINFSFQLWS